MDFKILFKIARGQCSLILTMLEAGMLFANLILSTFVEPSMVAFSVCGCQMSSVALLLEPSFGLVPGVCFIIVVSCFASLNLTGM